MIDRLVSHLRRVNRPLLCLGAVLVTAAAAAGQAADVRNAATWYQRAFERLGSIEITEAEWTAIRAYQQDPHAPVNDTVRAVLMRAAPVLSAAQRGTQQDYSDFGLDYGEGYELLLPHLSQLRNVGRLMAANAKLHLQEGSATLSAAEIASAYRMGEHLGSDATIISSLVGQVIFEGADQVAASGIDGGAFGPAESAALREALAQFGADDPFDMIGALETERMMMVDWLRDRYANAEDRASLLDDWGAEPGAEEALVSLTLMDQATFDTALDQADQTLGRVIEAFKMDDPDEARIVLAQISADIENGQNGLLTFFMPAYGKIYERMIDAREQIAERAGQLDAIIAGRVRPGELANAAVLYLQAVEMIRAIDPARRARLREVIAQPVQPIGDEAARTLRDAEAIVQTLRRAALIPRCDFSIVHGRHPPVIPDYAGGLREAGALLVADAVRLLQEAEDGQAADRLWIGFRMSAHLAGDPIITSALVSHTVFASADELARWALGNGAFSTDERAQLFLGVELIPRRDPFGYVAAVMSAREQILPRLHFTGDARLKAEQALRTFDGDRLLYLLVVIDAPRSAEAEPQPLPTELADVLSLEALAAARARAEQVMRMIEETDSVEVVADQAPPPIGRVAERQAAARADLRRAYFALQPDEN
jgi:hypothetical protein